MTLPRAIDLNSDIETKNWAEVASAFESIAAILDKISHRIVVQPSGHVDNDSYTRADPQLHLAANSRGHLSHQLRIVRDEIEISRLRNEYLHKDFENSSAPWNILLDLYENHLLEKNVSITSACIASMCPPTTALRWVVTLEQHGYVSRMPDSSDGRRFHLYLTDLGMKVVQRYLLIS